MAEVLYTQTTMALQVACLLKHVFLEPSLDCFSTSTPKKPAKRGPKPKQIGISDYCRTCGCFVYLNSTGHSSRSLKATENLFFFRVFVKASQVDERFKRSQKEDQPIRFCSHCSNQVKSTRAVFFNLSQLSRKRA